MSVTIANKNKSIDDVRISICFLVTNNEDVYPGPLSFWKLFLISQSDYSYVKISFGWLDRNDNIKWEKNKLKDSLNIYCILLWYKLYFSKVLYIYMSVHIYKILYIKYIYVCTYIYIKWYINRYIMISIFVSIYLSPGSLYLVLVVIVIFLALFFLFLNCHIVELSVWYPQSEVEP